MLRIRPEPRISPAPGRSTWLDNPTSIINLGVAFGSTPKFGFDGTISGQINGAAAAKFDFSTAGGSAAPSLTNAFSPPGEFSLYGNSPVSGTTANLCASDSACKFSANFTAGGLGKNTEASLHGERGARHR